MYNVDAALTTISNETKNRRLSFVYCVNNLDLCLDTVSYMQDVCIFSESKEHLQSLLLCISIVVHWALFFSCMS